MYVCTIPKIPINYMIKRLFVVFLLLFSGIVYAQYTEVINSNRPGFSESPYSVGTGVYQLESSLFYRNAPATPMFSNPGAYGANLHLRAGVLDEFLELNFSTSLQNDILGFQNVFESSYTKFGFGQLTLGGKYLVFIPTYKNKVEEIRSWNERHKFDWRRWIPHIAVSGGVDFISALNDYHKRGGGIKPYFGVQLQNEFSDKLNFISNFYYKYIGSDLPEFSFILTETYNFNERWSAFAEYQASFNELEKQSNLGLGAAYLFNRNLQVNTSLRATFQEESLGVFTSVGLSYRLDRHIDHYDELDEFGNKIEADEKRKSYNKGIIGRLIDKIKNLFKKKDKREVQLEEENKTLEGEEIEEESDGRTRTKSVLDDLVKDDKKEKKQTTKEEKKSAKKKLKEEEKAKRDAEKEKLKAEKELEKIERELKKEEDKIQRELDKEDEKLKREEEKLKKEEDDEKKKEENEDDNK